MTNFVAADFTQLIPHYVELSHVAAPGIRGDLPGKSHGRRSLEGYSPWGGKESDTTEHLTHTLINMMILSLTKVDMWEGK